VAEVGGHAQRAVLLARLPHITHPTAPRAARRKDGSNHAALIKKMLANWNDGLQALKPGIAHPDKNRNLVLYGEAFAAGDKKPIPMDDLPPGSPEWMATDDGWADRTGTGRRKPQIQVTAPKSALP
jgi:hypothetical protein